MPSPLTQEEQEQKIRESREIPATQKSLSMQFSMGSVEQFIARVQATPEHVSEVFTFNSALSDFTCDEICQFLQALPHHIHHIALNGNALNRFNVDEWGRIFAALPPTVTSLDISGGCLSHKPTDEVQNILRTIPAQITKLDLSHNDLEYRRTQEEMALIITSIPESVKELALSANLSRRYGESAKELLRSFRAEHEYIDLQGSFDYPDLPAVVALLTDADSAIAPGVIPYFIYAWAENTINSTPDKSELMSCDLFFRAASSSALLERTMDAYKEKNSAVGLILCGLLLQGVIPSRTNDPSATQMIFEQAEGGVYQVMDSYWAERYNQAMDYYLQAAEQEPNMQALCSNLLWELRLHLVVSGAPRNQYSESFLNRIEAINPSPPPAYTQTEASFRRPNPQRFFQAVADPASAPVVASTDDAIKGLDDDSVSLGNG